MPTTVIKDSANKKSFVRKTKAFIRGFYKNDNDDINGKIYHFDSGDVAIASTSVDEVGDEVYALQFPLGAKLINMRTTWTDMDGGATGIMKVLTQTEAGAETDIVTLLNFQTAGATESIGTDHLFQDVGGQYLGIKITTASAVPAAGTIRFKGLIYIGDALSGF